MSNIIRFPTDSPMFGLSREDFLRLAIKDTLFVECYAIATEEDIEYNEDSGLPIFDEDYKYDRLANSYFGYILGVVIQKEEKGDE